MHVCEFVHGILGQPRFCGGVDVGGGGECANKIKH